MKVFNTQAPFPPAESNHIPSNQMQTSSFPCITPTKVPNILYYTIKSSDRQSGDIEWMKGNRIQSRVSQNHPSGLRQKSSLPLSKSIHYWLNQALNLNIRDPSRCNKGPQVLKRGLSLFDLKAITHHSLDAPTHHSKKENLIFRDINLKISDRFKHTKDIKNNSMRIGVCTKAKQDVISIHQMRDLTRPFEREMNNQHPLTSMLYQKGKELRYKNV